MPPSATAASFGSWRSPITSALLVEKVVGLSQIDADGDAVYWNESRPAEGGRQVIVRRDSEGVESVVFGAEFSARTLVHEYGGVCHTEREGVVWFSNFTDQRVYRIDPGGEPVAITPAPPSPASVRFADFQATPDGRWLVGVRERHLASDVVNDLVAFPSSGSADGDGDGAFVVLANGHDFFSAPRVSPDSSRVAWLSWDHSNMPWDGTELWVADLATDMSVASPRLVAGGLTESISQPRWSPDATLHFVSDRTNWWNLYADDGAGGRLLEKRDAEFSGPDWAFGQSTYVFQADGTIVTVWSEAGSSHLGLIPPGGVVMEVPVAYPIIGGVVPIEGGVLASVGSPTESSAIARIALPSGDVEVLKRSREQGIDAGYLSVPRAIEFPTEGGLTAHAFFYLPANKDFVGLEGERPPLIVISHGGPTGATSSAFNLGIQYWTSRGFAVVDVNYGGSTGYGREYRERLKDNWGIVDVDDCVNAALWLADQGEVDRDRLVIRGGSAGAIQRWLHSRSATCLLLARATSASPTRAR